MTDLDPVAMRRPAPPVGRRKKDPGGTALRVATAALLCTAPARAAFDLVGPTARGTALGGAGAAAVHDISALYYNPAGLAALESSGLAFTHNRIGNFSFLSYNLAHGAIELGRFGGVAVGFRRFATESESGEALASESTWSVGWGVDVMEDVHSRLSLGATAHVYVLDYGTPSAGTYVPGEGEEDPGTYAGGQDLGSAATVGIDVGARAELERRLAVAVVLRNANRPSMGSADRVQMREKLVVGGAYEPYPGVLTALEVEMASGREPAEFRAGIEYRPSDYFSLRAGSGSDPARISAGIGVNFDRFEFDYAYGSHPVLPGTHVLGVRVGF